MHSSHRCMIKKAIFDYGKNGENTYIRWIDRNVGMVCLAVHKVWFTAEMEEVFQRMKEDRKNTMRIFLEQKQIQLKNLIDKGCEQTFTKTKKNNLL